MGDNQGSDQTRPRPSMQDVHERSGNIETPPPAASPETREKVEHVLVNHIERERGGLKSRFFTGALGTAHINQATKMFTELKAKGCTKELALNLSILVLYDLVILIG